MFASNPALPNAFHGPKFSIPTGNAIPTKDVPRRMALGKEIKVRKHVDLMLQNGIINESNSQWSALVVMAQKKDGSWRFCIDYQRLNSVTKRTLTRCLGLMTHLMHLVLARDAYSVQWTSRRAIGISQSKTAIRRKPRSQRTPALTSSMLHLSDLQELLVLSVGDE